MLLKYMGSTSGRSSLLLFLSRSTVLPTGQDKPSPQLTQTPANASMKPCLHTQSSLLLAASSRVVRTSSQLMQPVWPSQIWYDP